MREVGLSIMYSVQTHPETGHRSRQMRRDCSIARLRRGGDCQFLLPPVDIVRSPRRHCRCRNRGRFFQRVIFWRGVTKYRKDSRSGVPNAMKKLARFRQFSTSLGPSNLRDVSLTHVVKLRDVSLTRVRFFTSLQMFQGIFRSLLYNKAKRYEVHLLTAKTKFTLCTTSTAILPESRAWTRTIPRPGGGGEGGDSVESSNSQGWTMRPCTRVKGGLVIPWHPPATARRHRSRSGRTRRRRGSNPVRRSSHRPHPPRASNRASN